MGSYEEGVRKLADAVQPHLAEPVVAVMPAQRAGAYGRALGNTLGGSLVGLFGERRAKKAAGGLPPTVLLVLTETGLHAFGYKPKGFGGVAVTPAAAWPRQGVTVSTEPGRVTNRIVLHGSALPEPIHLEYASFGGGQQLLEDFLQAANVHPPGQAGRL